MVATRNHESRKGHRLDRHRLLKEPVEQLAPVPRHPAIKTVGNLPRRRHTTHWAWLTQVDTPQRANELRLGMELPAEGVKNGGPMWTAASEICCPKNTTSTEGDPDDGG